MIKKLLLAIFVTMSLTAIAQTGAGQWVVHPYFQGSTSSTSNCNCIDAGDKVYYLSGGSLFCFDKATETNRTLDLNSTLNDVKINQIYYNFDKGYLLVTYADCNIDIVKADGTVVNLPGIRDVVMSTTKSINDVTFAQDKAFVATSFGYITINDNNFAIGEIRDFEAQGGKGRLVQNSPFLSGTKEQIDTNTKIRKSIEQNRKLRDILKEAGSREELKEMLQSMLSELEGAE